jgi:hypothetical protein
MRRKIYSEKEFMKLVKKNAYQVFFFVSRVSMPLFFAAHPWIVTNEKGKMRRIEVLSYKNKKSGNYVWISEKEFSAPLPVFTGNDAKKYRYSRVIKLFEGSPAKEIISFLKDIDKKYPEKGRYVYFPGPNSNTFVKWVIHSLGLGVELPKNAYGERYMIN